MPMYQKQNDPDTWLSMCKTKAGSWRWYIKPAKEKGPESSVCFGYGVSNDIVFPQECDSNCWHCYDGTAFVKEKGIVVALTLGSTMTEDVLALKTKRQQEWAAEKENLTAQVCFVYLLLISTHLL